MSDPTAEIPQLSERDLEAGERVGEYEVEGKLGQGAFGTVYKASHPLIGKVVAIKVLARKFSVDPEMVSRFVAEARAVNQIRNRHIIDIFSFGALDDDRQYYVMEYLDGEPLDALIDRVGNLTLADALPILRGIAKALDAAHAKDIAHRDLKAENVFLASDPDGGVFPKLLDFGIAKLLSSEDPLKHKTRTGAPIGTPYYMSPEQCRGRQVDHRTDHYAFGVLVYRMLTGVYPFDGEDYMSILVQQINDAPKAPSTHLPDLPAAIDDVVMWLLAKDPADRPPDLRTAVRALEQAGRDAGIAPPATGWDTGPAGLSSSQPPVAVPRKSHLVAAAAAPTVGLTPAPTTNPPEPRKKSRAPMIAVIAGAAVLAIAGIVVVMGKGGDTKPPAPVAAPVPPAPPTAIEKPVTPEVPKTVIVTVAGVPEGTEVSIGGTVVGAAPGPVQVPHGDGAVVLTFRADGYLPTSKSVVPDADKTLDVTLKKKPRAKTGGGKPGRDDIIDVFSNKKG